MGQRRQSSPLFRPQPIIVATAVIVLGVIAVYTLPAFESLRRSLGTDSLELPFRLLTLTALLYRLKSAEPRTDARFWFYIAAGFSCWFIGDLVFATATDSAVAVTFREDLIFLPFYAFLALAVGVAPPHRCRVGFIRLQEIGALLFILAAFACLVAIPAWLDPTGYLEFGPSYAFFALIDAFLAVHFLALAARRHSAPWRGCHLMIGLALTAWTLVDGADALAFAGVISIPTETFIDVLWFAPYLPMLLAATLLAQVESPSLPRTIVPRGGAVPALLGYALLLTSLHIVVRVTGWLDSTQVEREAVVAGSVVVFAALALHHRHSASGKRLVSVVVTDDDVQEAQKMEALGRLAGGVAHDFNNLLTVIAGNTEALLDKADRDSEERQCLHEITVAAERAAGLTRQLLAVSRRQVLDPRPVDLNAVVRDIRPLLERLLGEDVQIGFELDQHVGRVSADPSQLTQVLLNLAVNARSAMPDGGELLVSTGVVDVEPRGRDAGSAGPHVVLRVRDTGSGIEDSVRGRVFDPFFTTRADAGGHGLGLAVVHGIVQQSGGFVTVDSTPSEGSCFSVFLPCAAGEAQVEPSARLAPTRAAGRRGTVLVVEDDAEVRALLVRYLERLGYAPVAAGTGDDALEIASRADSAFELLVTDVVLPGINGPEVAERVRARRPETPVLFVSGYPAAVPVAGLERSEGTGFLSKPFTMRHLDRALRDLQEDRGPGAAAEA